MPLETSYAKFSGEGYMIITPGFDEYPAATLPTEDAETGNEVVVNPIVYQRVKDINDRVRNRLNQYIERVNQVISDLNKSQEDLTGADKLVANLVASQFPSTLIKKLSVNATELSLFEDSLWESVERYATE